MNLCLIVLTKFSGKEIKIESEKMGKKQTFQWKFNLSTLLVGYRKKKLTEFTKVWTTFTDILTAGFLFVG
jgi:hypothetical protein